MEKECSTEFLTARQVIINTKCKTLGGNHMQALDAGIRLHHALSHIEQQSEFIYSSHMVH